MLTVGSFTPSELQIANRAFMEELLKRDDLRLKALFVQGKVFAEYKLASNTLMTIKDKPENQVILREAYWEERYQKAKKRVLVIKSILHSSK